MNDEPESDLVASVAKTYWMEPKLPYAYKITMEMINKRYGTSFTRGSVIRLNGESYRLLHNHGWRLVVKRVDEKGSTYGKSLYLSIREEHD